MGAAVHLFKVVLFTLLICAFTLISNAEILVKEKSNYNKNYYAISFENEFAETMYDREELEELRKDYALEYIYDFIGNKFQQTPIGEYVIQKFDTVISYGRIEYSKKKKSEKANLYLPGDIDKSMDDVYDYRAALSFSLYIKDSKPCPTTRITWFYNDIDYVIGYDIKINEVFFIVKKSFYDVGVGLAYETENIEDEDEDERVYLFVLKDF